jgi:hypothetical protein
MRRNGEGLSGWLWLPFYLYLSGFPCIDVMIGWVAPPPKIREKTRENGKTEARCIEIMLCVLLGGRYGWQL